MKNPFTSMTPLKTSKFISILLLSFLVLGVSGCGSSSAAASQQPGSNQINTGQSGPGSIQRNPALQAVSEIRRLQNNQNNSEVALSTDQKNKLKPILQNLINTDNPTEDFLQKQADAINALLTDAQKNFLQSSRPNRANSGNQNNATNPNPSGQQNRANRPNRQNGTPNNNGNNRTFDAKTIYQQVLDSLNQ